MDKTLYILRGVSGAGKTTLANTLVGALPNAKDFSADKYFEDKEFDHSLLGEAHKQCKEGVEQAMKDGVSNIIVHNTSTTEKEMRPYIDFAYLYGYAVVSLVVENRHGHRDVHNVPATTLIQQECRLKTHLKLLP